MINRRLLLLATVVLLTGCAQNVDHLAEGVCAVSAHCYVHDTGPRYGPPQAQLVEPDNDPTHAHAH